MWTFSSYGYFCSFLLTKIGAGTALPGVVAAKCGALVTLSDAISLPECRDRGKTSVEANGLCDVKVIGITWGLVTPDLMDLPPQDVILASDCFYDSKGKMTSENIFREMLFYLQKQVYVIWKSLV